MKHAPESPFWDDAAVILQDMGRRRGQQKGYLYQEDDCWKARWYVDDIDATGKPTRKRSKPWVIGRSHGPGKLSKKQAQRVLAEKMVEVNRGGSRAREPDNYGRCGAAWITAIQPANGGVPSFKRGAGAAQGRAGWRYVYRSQPTRGK